MAKKFGSLLLYANYSEKTNLSSLEEVGDGEEAGLPIVVG
jgi:hypothetical protein